MRIEGVRVSLLWVVLWLVPGMVTADARHGAQTLNSGSFGPEGCLTWKAHAVYAAYGWDHRVVLKNGCTRAARCDVSTDVAPEVRSVRVSAGQEETVVTWRGSPASVFKAEVDCKLGD